MVFIELSDSLSLFFVFCFKLIIFVFQAYKWAGILYPRILFANHALVTGPAFYDMAHGPDFFPLYLNFAPKS